MRIPMTIWMMAVVFAVGNGAVVADEAVTKPVGNEVQKMNAEVRQLLSFLLRSPNI